MLDEIIRTAITERRMLEFSYHSFWRIVEPQVYGIKEGRHQLLAFQIGGESKSGGIPEWRRFDLDEIVDLRLLASTFPGARDHSAFHNSRFDVVLAVVS